MNKLLVELSNSNNQANKNYLIGTVTLLIFSTEVFKNNKDIVPFLEEVFNVSYLPYVMKSRTLISAKLGRELFHKNENELEVINKKLFSYFGLNNDSTGSKKKTKKNANDKLDSWLKGL
ncbi:hypothetical protein HF072_03940 [Bacillus sp. RO3]|nr:hypothetical protein [Bacillus sp. RO3]